MNNKTRLLLTLTSLSWLLLACVPQAEPPSRIMAPTAVPSPVRTDSDVLKVMTHDSFRISEEVLQVFQSENNTRVQFLKAGDTGTALNKAILTRDTPLADVFYGVDNTFLSRALEEDIFEPYSPPQLDNIPDEYKLDPESRAIPVDYGDVCLNYDKSYFSENNLKPPETLEELLKPAYKSLLVVENPAISSPGLAFMLATIGHFGPDGFLDFWSGLVANDVLVVNDWETAYYTEFSGSSGRGPRPIVVSYDSSPAFEFIFAETPIDEPPTAAVVSDESCFRQIEFVGILKGSERPDLARKWIDFMLSPTFQEDMPLQMAVFPVNPDAKLDEGFNRFLVLPEKTATLKPEEIAANREVWIEAWMETVLR